MKKLLWKNVWQTAVAIVFLLAVWGIAYGVVGNDLLLPPLGECLQEMGGLLLSGVFWKSFLGSLLRALSAFLLSFVLATIFAVIAYMVPSFERFFAPIVSVFRSLPVLAVLLILLSFLTARQAPVAVAFLSLFPMLYTGILAALSGIDKHLVETARVYGASPLRRVTKVYLPLSAPYILREAGGALSFSLKLVVSAEVLANTAKSLGGMMQEARIFDLPQLFALVLVTFLTGLIMELAVSVWTAGIERK